jgi:Ca2+-transporting ATPase
MRIDLRLQHEGEAIMSENWYQMTAAQTAEKLQTDPAQGLSGTEAARRLAEHGPNELVERSGRTPWKILLEQVSGVLTLILVLAAVISFFLGDALEAVVILAIVVLNAALGFFQEYRAEQSMAALKRMSVPTVRVRRDGHVQEVSAHDLVAGDVVVLETGNIVPADGRVLSSTNMRVQEAALTGESEPVDKEAALVFETDRALGDRRNMAYMGTIVTYGRGELIITDTGMNTELGHIAEMIQAVEPELTPLQQRLNKLGKSLSLVAILLVGLVFVLGLLRGGEIEEVLLTSVSLAVAAIPEAMTAVVTIALSLGAQRMLKRKALIRKLPAVETLGSVSVICSDKTGTLTQNRMTVTALDIANHRFDLTQRPGEAEMALVAAEGSEQLRAQPSLDLLLIGGAIANDATLTPDAANPKVLHAVGDPTEGALVLAAAQAGILKDALDQAFPRVAELPFDSVRKRMTTVHRTPTDDAQIPESLCAVWERKPTDRLPPYIAFTKGAIDGMLKVADRVWVEGEIEPLDEGWRKRVMAAHDGLAANGMRVLGVGLRPLDEAVTRPSEETLERDLILVGLFGLIDPPRPEVKNAVATCKSAGIDVAMITGDHPLTARHIAKQLGITESDSFVTGQELEEMSQEQLDQAINQTSVFARVSPEHKLKLVDAYQRRGEIVAMTGDGVNDAPALKSADIGVAMGITGTDVSKEAAEMVLLDDNFATIVAAVEEGRIIFDNIRKFIKYLLTCNASEIAVMLIGPFLGMPLPLLPLQILWMNLVTDGLPALALGVEPAEENVMRRPPYSSRESIFGGGVVRFIVGFGILMSLVSLLAGYLSWRAGNPQWQTIVFTTLIFAQLALALEVRSEENSLLKIGLFTNRPMIIAVIVTVLLQLLVIYLPFLQRIFKTQALEPGELLIPIALSLLVMAAVEVYKVFVRRSRRAATA